MTDLEKIVDEGFLRESEEIYLIYRGESYAGRIRNGGKIIETKLGTFSSLSLAASPLMGSNENCKRKFVKDKFYNNNGWKWWRTWNGTKLEDLRKKVIKNKR